MDFQPLRKTLIGICICLALQGCNKEDEGVSNRLQLQAHLDLANVYKSQGQFRAGVIEMQNADKLIPNDADVMGFLAQLYMDVGSVEQASQQLDAALKIKPDDSKLKLLKTEALLILDKVKEAQTVLDGVQITQDLQDKKDWLEGSIQASSGNIEAAKITFAKVIARNGSHIPSLIALAKIAVLERDNEKAQSYTKQAISAFTSSDDIDLWLWRGQFAVLQENYAEAETAYKSALDLMAGYDVMTAKKFVALQSILLPLQKLQKNDEALKYSQIIASTPQGAFNTAYTKAIGLLRKGSAKEAESELNTIIEAAPTNPGSNILLGLSKFSQGNFTDAEQLLSKYVDSSTASPQLIGTLAATHLQTGHPEKALSLLQDASAAAPDNAELLTMIGSIQIGMRSYSDAAETLNKALSKAPNSPSTLLAMVNLSLDQGKINEAISQLQDLIKLNPTLSQPKNQLLGLLVNQKRTDEANSTVNQWLKDDPGSALNNMLAGMLNLQLKDYGKAKQYLKVVQNKEKDNIQVQLYLARAAIGEEDYAGATTLLDGVLATQPNNAEAISGMLALGDLSKNSEASISRIKKLINENPKDFTAPLVLGQYYMQKRDLPNALSNIESAYDANQNQFTKNLYFEVLSQNVAQSLQSNDKKQADEYLKKALNIQSDNVQVNAMQVALAASANNFSLAREKIEYIRGLLPEHGLSFELEGDLLVAQQKANEALSAYQAAWNKEPTQSVGIKIYQALKFQKRTEEATKFLKAWLAADSKLASPNLLMAMELQSTQKDQEAIAYYEKVRAVEENNMLMLNNLAWLYQDSKPAIAMELAAKGARLYPQSSDVLDTYGWILYKQGELKKAKEVLQAALKLAPESGAIKEHLQKVN